MAATRLTPIAKPPSKNILGRVLGDDWTPFASRAEQMHTAAPRFGKTKIRRVNRKKIDQRSKDAADTLLAGKPYVVTKSNSLINAMNAGLEDARIAKNAMLKGLPKGTKLRAVPPISVKKLPPPDPKTGAPMRKKKDLVTKNYKKPSDNAKNTAFTAATAGTATATAAKARAQYELADSMEARRQAKKLGDADFKAVKMKQIKAIPKNKAVQGLAAGTLALGAAGVARHARSKKK